MEYPNRNTSMTAEVLREQTGSESDSNAESLPSAADGESATVLHRMLLYSELTDLAFMCVDVVSGKIIAKSDPTALGYLPAEVHQQLSEGAGVRVLELSSGLLFYAVPLPDINHAETVAVGFILARPGIESHELTLAAAEENWSQEKLDCWIAELTCCSPRILTGILEMAVEQVDHDGRETSLQYEIEQLGDQVEKTYEEINLLHSLTRNLQISRCPAELAELCLNRIHVLIPAEGNVIWIEEKHGSPHFLFKGEIPFDELGMARLIARFEDNIWSRPLVKNKIEGTLLGADYPGLRNLVIIPIAEGTHRSGWILSCNMPDGKEFGTVEASLLNSIAAILGTHVRNIHLYQEHDELLLSFVRSLVSTLDAKDPYTRGHSERVALIARRLGEEFDLPEEDLHDIYLSGLLHDIGKIGVDDRILQKPGKLSPEEFGKIQQHPMIGNSILQGMKNLQKILPGVRNHHEAFSGKGYPDGLRGEAIPLMARILAVADSYDAMGSNRPYREGLPLEKIEEIFKRGAGEQWDPRVIDAYFSIRDVIAKICSDYSPQHGSLFPGEITDLL